MERNDRVLLSALGLALGLVLLVWAIVGGAFAMPDNAGWIYNYQSLITGLIAFGAAGIGAWFLQKQIRQHSEIEDNRRARKRDALRAVGPITLNNVIDYTVPCAAVLKELYRQCEGVVLPTKNVTTPHLPAIPQEAVSLLVEFIESSDSGEADLIVELLSDIQLQSARVRGLISVIGRDDKMITKGNIEEYLIDTAILYARASAGFDFFRRRSDTLPTGISWEKVRSAARQLDLYENSYPNLYARIDRLAEQSAGPLRFGKALAELRGVGTI